MSVSRRFLITNFTYHDLPIVNDLRSAVDAYSSHDLVAALAGVPEARESLRLRNESADPVEGPTHVAKSSAPVYLVHDADSSQETVVRDAVNGRDLVVDGPPGTGKSQTIANLISSLIGNRRSVLFVAEKRAAIDAVVRYLGNAGLDHLVFDVHSGLEAPRKAAATIKQAMDRAERIPSRDFAELDGRVSETRGQLDGRSAALNEMTQPWGVSLWDALGVIYGMPSDARDDESRIPTDRQHLTSVADLHSVEESLRLFVELGGAPVLLGQSAWSDAHRRGTIADAASVDSVRSLISSIVDETIPTFRQAGLHLAQVTGLRAPDSIDQWPPLFDLLNGVQDDLSTFEQDVFDADLERLVAAYAPVTRGILVRAAQTMTSSEYRAARREIAQLARGARPHSADLHRRLSHAAEIRQSWRHLAASRPTCPLDSVNSCRSWHQHLEGQLLALERLVGRPFALSRLDELEAALRRLESDEITLARLPKLRQIDEDATRRGFGTVLQRACRLGLSPQTAGLTTRWVWYRMVVVRLMAQHEIANNTRSTLDRAVTGFIEHDRSALKSNRHRVERQWAEHVHQTRKRLPDEYERLKRATSTRQGFMPSSVRRLLSESPETLLALRPCWTMSPLVASQLLPQVPGLFDVVIFDEASQVKPVHALPAIMRASQVVVCGDDKQLPPTAFFDLADDDEADLDDDDGVAGMESILTALGAALPQRRTLRWHYRSQDDRLISFCNDHPDLYNGSLVTFPGARLTSPVSLVPVTDNTSDRSTSPQAEVDMVVDLVRQHARLRPDTSLGVISFGIKHAERIETALRLARTDDPELEDFLESDRVAEPFFVKSIERVQGDERDAIIVTPGLGHGPDGRLLNRLGVINQEGGIRRLNVAFTRARQAMTLVASFRQPEIEGPNFTSPGAKMLAAYSRYAAAGGAKSVTASGAELNPFESAVGAAIAGAQIPFRPQWGASGYFIDFALEHPDEPGRFVLAVECDGRRYHSSAAARDRDRLRQEHLQRLGWRFHRIWSTDWYQHRDRELQILVDAYRASVTAAAGPSDLVGPAAASAEPERIDETPRRGPRPRLQTGLKIDQITEAELDALIRWIQSDTLLRSREQLIREAANELGFLRVGARIREALSASAERLGL